jgi:hypothetical protein
VITDESGVIVVPWLHSASSNGPLRRRFVKRQALALAFALLAACGGGGPSIHPATGPQLGKGDSGDEPDRLCRIVLREMRSIREGFLDVDTIELDRGGAPIVMFTFDGENFLEIRDLERVDGGVGFQRFKFELPDDGDRVEVIPYLKVQGGRLSIQPQHQ